MKEEKAKSEVFRNWIRKWPKFDDWVDDWPNSKVPPKESQLELAAAVCDEAKHRYPELYSSSTLEQCQEKTERRSSQNRYEYVSDSGVSVEWFQRCFMKLPEVQICLEYECRIWFVFYLCIPEMKCKRKIDSGPLIDHLDKFVPRVKQSKGKAKAFVVYNSQYKLSDFASLVNHGDLKNRFMWIWPICLDEKEWKTYRMDDDFRQRFLSEELPRLIRRIGFTALMVDKFDKLMEAIGSQWMIWELYVTADCHKSTLRVLLSDNERERFLDRLSCANGLDEIQASFSNFDAGKVQSWSDRDTEHIKREMEKKHGIFQVNNIIMERIREWMRKAGESYLYGNQLPADTLVHMGLRINLATLYHDLGRYKSAEKLYKELLEECAEHELGPRHELTLRATINLSRLLLDQLRYNDAGTLCSEAYSSTKDLLKTNPLRWSAIDNYSRLQRSQGDIQGAQKLCEEAYEGRQTGLGEKHKDTLISKQRLAMMYLGYNKTREAGEILLKTTLDQFRSLLGDKHHVTLSCIQTLADVLRDSAKYEDSEDLNLEALKGRREQLGNRHPSTLSSLNSLGNLYRDVARVKEKEEMVQDAENCYKEAEGYYEEALKRRRIILTSRAPHPDTIETISNLAFILSKVGKISRAAELYQEALDGRRQLTEQDGDNLNRQETDTTRKELAGLLVRLKTSLIAEADKDSWRDDQRKLVHKVDAKLELATEQVQETPIDHFGGISVFFDDEEREWRIQCEPLELRFRGKSILVFRSDMERDVYKLCLPGRVNAKDVGAVFVAHSRHIGSRTRKVDTSFEDYSGMSYFDTLEAALDDAAHGDQPQETTRQRVVAYICCKRQTPTRQDETVAKSNAYELRKTKEHPRNFRISLAAGGGVYIESKYRKLAQWLAVVLCFVTAGGSAYLGVFARSKDGHLDKNNVALSFLSGIAAGSLILLLDKICFDPPGSKCVLSYRKVFNHEEAKTALGIGENEELAVPFYNAGINPYETSDLCSPMGQGPSHLGWEFHGIRTKNLEPPNRLFNLLVSADGKKIGSIENGEFDTDISDTSIHVLRKPPNIVKESEPLDSDDDGSHDGADSESKKGLWDFLLRRKSNNSKKEQ